MNIEKAMDIMETWLERSRQDMSNAIRTGDHAMYDVAAEKQAVLVCVLNELSAREDRWIRTEDRQPALKPFVNDEGESWLQSDMVIVFNGGEAGEGWYEDDGNGPTWQNDIHGEIHPTHWMPMPEGPEVSE